MGRVLNALISCGLVVAAAACGAPVPSAPQPVATKAATPSPMTASPPTVVVSESPAADPLAIRPGRPYVGHLPDPTRYTANVPDVPPREVLLGRLAAWLTTADGRPYDASLDIHVWRCSTQRCDAIIVGRGVDSAGYDTWGVTIAANGQVAFDPTNSQLNALPKATVAALDRIASADQRIAAVRAEYDILAWAAWDPNRAGVYEIAYGKLVGRAPDAAPFVLASTGMELVIATVDARTRSVTDVRRMRVNV